MITIWTQNIYLNHCADAITKLPYNIQQKGYLYTGYLLPVSVLQHYLPDEIMVPLFVWVIFGVLSGTRTINSLSSQFRASQIRSKCSRLTLSTNSWYNSFIVFGRIPVALARSACVHLISPSFVDSKILIIRCCSFRYKITPNSIFLGHLLFYSEIRAILSKTDRTGGADVVPPHKYLPSDFLEIFS